MSRRCSMNSVRLYARPRLVTDGMGELRLDHVGADSESLAQDGPRRCAKSMSGHFFGRIAHGSQRRVDGVVAHRSVVMALAPKDQLSAAGQWLKVAQHGDGLLRQRDQMWRPAQLADQLPLHARRRNRP
jgi:uncharacterized protein YfiM (DUF2279 family)